MGPGIPPEMAKEHLERGQELIFTLVGTSMWPVMGRGGAEVRVQPLNDSAWRVGARVLITDKERLVLHRVVALEPGRALVKGDNNRFLDGWYAREELLAGGEKRRGPCRGDSLVPLIQADDARGPQTTR